MKLVLCAAVLEHLLRLVGWWDKGPGALNPKSSLGGMGLSTACQANPAQLSIHDFLGQPPPDGLHFAGEITTF